MEKTTIDVTLALGQSRVRRVVTVKRYDSHCTLRLRLTHGGSPYPVTEDCQGVFTALKPDGTVIYNPCTREGNAFLYDLTPQTTAVAGELPCELKLYGPEEALLTSAGFLLSVADTVYSGDEELASTTEAETLTQLVNQAGDKLSKMNSVLQLAGNLVLIDNSVAGKYAWSGKHIADTLCPAFTEKGSLVTCKPLGGYPLEVISDFTGNTENLGKLHLYRGGKNLITLDDWSAFTKQEDGSYKSNKTISATLQIPLRLPAGTYRVSCYIKCPQGCNYRPIVYYADGTSANGYVASTGDWVRSQFTASGKEIVAFGLYYGATSDEVYIKELQIEVGSVATDYEPYRGTVLTVDMAGLLADGEGSYNWNTGVLTDTAAGWIYQLDPETGAFTQVGETGDIEAGIYTPASVEVLPAASGKNLVYTVTESAEVACTTTVSGRLDPLPLLEKLQNL